MADSTIAITAGTGTAVDTRTESTNGHHRQVVVLGDPATNAGVAPVDATAGLKVDLGADNDIVVTNAGTFATQATLQAGSAAIGKLAANSGVDIGDVDVTSSALPTGASTSAKQPALGTAGTASTDVITVQGIASMTALKVDNSAVTQPVSGTVTTNLSATDNAVLDSIQAGTDKIPALGQALAAGSVPVVMTASQLTTLTPPAAITGYATSAKQDTIIGHVDGVETLLGTIDSKLGGTLTVTGGGGGTEYTEDAAAAANPVGTVLQLIREDARAGGLTTTDGDNVAVRGNNKGEMYVKTTDSDALLTTIDADTSTLAGAVSGTEMQVDVLTMPTTAVTNAGITTIAGAVSGTEMQVDVLTMPTTTVTATDLDIRPLVNTDVITAELSAVDNAVLDTIAAKDFATQTTLAAMNAKMVTGTDIGDVTINNSTGASAVNIQDGGNTITVDGTVGVSGTVAVTQSGTWDEVGINDSGNSITVDYATTGSGTATGALRVELPTNGTGVIATVGAVTAITNALPAGTNAIGKLSANSGVDIGDVTLTANSGVDIGSTKGLPSDIDINGSNANHADKYYTNAGAVTDGIVWSPAAGKRWHILTLYINVSAAATVTLEDDLAGGDVARWKGELAANSGVVLTYDKEHPFCSGEDAADLIITTTAGNVYVQAVGYEI